MADASLSTGIFTNEFNTDVRETRAISGTTTQTVTGDIDSSTIVTSMGDLKEVAPEVYKQTLITMAEEMNRQSDRHQRRLREIRQKGM